MTGVPQKSERKQISRQVEELHRLAKSQATEKTSWQAWDLRRLWTYLWKRAYDSTKRGQVPRDRAVFLKLVC